MIKLLQYIRYKEEYAYFVQMFFAVINDLGPFILMFTGFVSVFSLIQYILSSQGEDAEEFYPGIHPFLSMLI